MMGPKLRGWPGAIPCFCVILRVRRPFRRTRVGETGPVISFAEDEVTRYIGDGGFRNPLEVPSYVEEVLYSSSDTSVAVVDGAGNVTVVGVGHAVITAYVPGTENYNEASAWFTVNVSSTPTVVIPGDDDVIVLPGPETVKWYEKDISLYILLIVIVVIGFALYILYTVWSRRRNE